MTGVGAAAHNDNVLPNLISDRHNYLAADQTMPRIWISQQDNALAHEARMNKEVLNDSLPGRRIQN